MWKTESNQLQCVQTRDGGKGWVSRQNGNFQLDEKNRLEAEERNSWALKNGVERWDGCCSRSFLKPT